MSSKFIEQKHYAEKLNTLKRERERERERESNNRFETLSLRIGHETII